MSKSSKISLEKLGSLLVASLLVLSCASRTLKLPSAMSWPDCAKQLQEGGAPFLSGIARVEVRPKGQRVMRFSLLVGFTQAHKHYFELQGFGVPSVQAGGTDQEMVVYLPHKGKAWRGPLSNLNDTMFGLDIKVPSWAPILLANLSDLGWKFDQVEQQGKYFYVVGPHNELLKVSSDCKLKSMEALFNSSYSIEYSDPRYLEQAVFYQNVQLKGPAGQMKWTFDKLKIEKMDDRYFKLVPPKEVKWVTHAEHLFD